MWPHRRQPTRLSRPWDSPGKNTGVGCHFLLQCVKLKLLSRVRLLGIPWTAAHQAPLSMGFSRQKYWSGVPLPSPMQVLKLGKWICPGMVWCVCPTLWSNPMDCSLPGSSVHGLFQARILKWAAISSFRGILWIQGSNPHLLHLLSTGRWIVYCCTTWEAPA